MLHVQVLDSRDGRVLHGAQPYLHALNDIVVGRDALGRTILLSAFIDGSLVADYRADGVIVATATGSTAYSQSIGGPILHPEAKEMVLVPLAPHLGQANSLVLPASSVVDLALDPEHTAALSIDGESRIDLGAGPRGARDDEPARRPFLAPVRLAGLLRTRRGAFALASWLRVEPTSRAAQRTVSEATGREMRGEDRKRRDDSDASRPESGEGHDCRRCPDGGAGQ